MDEIKEVNKEVIVEKSSTKATIIQIMFLIIMLCAIGALINSTITIYKYRDMLKNPMGYNMERFNMVYCTCYDNNFKTIPIKSPLFNSSFEDFVAKPVICPYQPILNSSLVLN